MDYRYFVYCIILIELITAIIASNNWKKYRTSSEKNFIYYFWILFIIDLSGHLFGVFFELSNYWIYNCLMIFQFLLLLKWYSKLNIKKFIIFGCLFFYGLVIVVSFYNENFFKSYQSINFTGGVFIIILCSFLYYLKIFNSNIILNLKHHLPFWIVIGNIIFFIGALPVILMKNYLDINYLNYLMILTLLNCVSNTCYILGFKWVKSK